MAVQEAVSCLVIRSLLMCHSQSSAERAVTDETGRTKTTEILQTADSAHAIESLLCMAGLMPLRKGRAAAGRWS